MKRMLHEVKKMSETWRDKEMYSYREIGKEKAKARLEGLIIGIIIGMIIAVI